MLKTLDTYISLELAKATILALIVFTLVLTVFAIMEPLREQGLAGEQVGMLFAYTLPVMLSLTLPIGALFAATIVYGRFSQDNELLACRASGVSTMAVLRPALVQAMIVTAASLLLSNLVAPAMAARAGRAVKTNIRGILYSSLGTRGYIESPSAVKDRYLVHADRVDAENDILHGVVGIHIKRPGGEMRVATAERTEITFTEEGDESYVLFDALYVTGRPLAGFDYAWERRQRFPRFKIPDPTREKPSWYTWGRLVRTIRHPEEDDEIAEELDEIRRAVANDIFCRELSETINGEQPGRAFELTGGGITCLLRAGGAKVGRRGAVELYSDRGVPVSVRSWDVDPEHVAERLCVGALMSGGPAAAPRAADVLLYMALPEIAVGEVGQVKTRSDSPSVRVRLSKGVSILRPAIGQQRRSEWLANVELPERLATKVEHISLDNAAQEAARLTNSEAILRKVARLRDVLIPSLRGKLVGEMHGRISYGVSCFLLVALGAALGLIFRGGQIVSAFATGAVPAAAVIVLVIMGKELARNSQVPLAAGLAVIWAGVAALAVACGLVYLHLARK